MTIKINVTDPTSGIKAVVDKKEGEKNALVVTNRELKSFINKPVAFTNDTYGAEMNQNAAFTGTPILVYDENVGAPTEWVTSAITGTWDFASATQHKNGSVSVEQISPTTANATAAFTLAATQDLTGYAAITAWIYLTTIPTGAYNIGGFLAGVNQGINVDVTTVINTTLLNTWQKIVVDFIDLNLTDKTIDSFRLTKVEKLDKFYFDYFRIQETGGGVSFKVEPAKGTWLHVTGMQVVIVDAYTGITTVAGATENATMPKIPFNGFFAETKFATGIIYQRVTNNVIVQSSVIKQFIDLLLFSNATVSGYGSDGTNSWVSVLIQFAAPIILKAEDEDYMALIISDDLSGLLELKVITSGKEETR